MKDYWNLSIDELEVELVELVRKNLEEGVSLLDENYNLKKTNELVDLEKDDYYCLINILSSMMKTLNSLDQLPNMKEYFSDDIC